MTSDERNSVKAGVIVCVSLAIGALAGFVLRGCNEESPDGVIAVDRTKQTAPKSNDIRVIRKPGGHAAVQTYVGWPSWSDICTSDYKDEVEAVEVAEFILTARVTSNGQQKDGVVCVNNSCKVTPVTCVAGCKPTHGGQACVYTSSDGIADCMYP